jgi:hypothetical protein
VTKQHAMHRTGHTTWGSLPRPIRRVVSLLLGLETRGWFDVLGHAGHVVHWPGPMDYSAVFGVRHPRKVANRRKEG